MLGLTAKGAGLRVSYNVDTDEYEIMEIGNLYCHYCSSDMVDVEIPREGFWLEPGETCGNCGAVMPAEENE